MELVFPDLGPGSWAWAAVPVQLLSFRRRALRTPPSEDPCLSSIPEHVGFSYFFPCSSPDQAQQMSLS